MVPTWRDFKSGIDGVSKRLGRFLVAENIVEKADRLKSWVGEGGSSNHSYTATNREG